MGIPTFNVINFTAFHNEKRSGNENMGKLWENY